MKNGDKKLFGKQMVVVLRVGERNAFVKILTGPRTGERINANFDQLKAVPLNPIDHPQSSCPKCHETFPNYRPHIECPSCGHKQGYEEGIGSFAAFMEKHS